MPTIDNDVYNRAAASWRDENHPLSLLVPATPPRVAYVREVLTEKVGLTLEGLPLLDVGCGGGLVSEELAKLGCRVTGVDPSAPSVEAARAHAAQEGLEIDYRVGSGEQLLCSEGEFMAACCLDVLEHVDDLDRVIAEIARVLQPGGVFVYDTVNRTFMSKVAMIKVAQEWRWSSFMSPNFHIWEKFIKPEELRAVLVRHGFEPREVVGMSLASNPLSAIRMLRKLKRGAITYGAFGTFMAGNLRLGRDLSTSYLGYAVKRA